MAQMVKRIYQNFRGADFRGEDVNLTRSPDCLNIWKDYKQIESIRTRPGLRLHTAFAAPVYGIFFFDGEMIVHSGNTLYREGTAIYSPVAEQAGKGFVYEDKWYFLDGENYLQYDGSAVTAVGGYVPTTTIGRKPAGGGTKFEDVNMLTGRRKNTFLADGMSFDYYLDAQQLDADWLPTVTVDDQPVTDFTVDYTEGKISFTRAPDAPLTDGQDNVCVEFCKTVENYRGSILGCRLLQVFDNRVFVSGNPAYPNVVWHCSLNDPSYFSDLDYYREGMDEAQIRGLVAGNNALWVFREPSEANTNVFYHTPVLDEEYGKIYPSVHSSITIGCTGAAINFGDDIVFFSDRGMEGISGDVTTEQAAAHRSTLADRKLTPEAGYRDMLLEEWEGYLLVIIGDHIYLADSRGIFNHENHVEYEWFYWEMERPILCTKVKDGTLYVGTPEGVYTLDDHSCAVSCHWVTPKDRAGFPSLLKTTNKRGCVGEATGDVTVLAKTDKSEFEQIGVYTNVTDHFVSRIKRKKFKDIQLKFQSDTRFSLEAVTLEFFIGGYIKR